MQRPKVEVKYYFFPQQQAELLADTLRDDFDVRCRKLLLRYPVGVIEIALGVLAGTVGSIALKKFVELVVEDIYKGLKRFLKAVKFKKGRLLELRLSFELKGVCFTGKVTSHKKKEFSQAFKTLGKLFEIAKQIVSSNRLPKDIVLEELYPKDGAQIRVLDGTNPLPKKLEWVCVEFGPELGLWKVERIHKDGFGTFVIKEKARRLRTRRHTRR